MIAYCDFATPTPYRRGDCTDGMWLPCGSTGEVSSIEWVAVNANSEPPDDESKEEEPLEPPPDPVAVAYVVAEPRKSLTRVPQLCELARPPPVE